jgi:cyclic beta-1,2-glucan synthetase
MAQARLAQTEPDGGPAAQRAWQYFQDLSPAHRSADPVLGPTYGLEPYVIAGDICSAPPYVGRGGWSWYTGAAAWLHRAAIESLFGLKWGPRRLWFEPCLPPLWPQAELRLRRSGRTLHFLLIRSAPAEALEEAKPWLSGFPGTLLAPRAILEWDAAADGSRFVVPLRSPPGTAP